MADEHVTRILKLLEEGKISAKEAESLIAALRTTSASEGSSNQQGTNAGGRQHATDRAEGATSERSFEFSWGRRRGRTLDLGGLGRQISEALGKIDAERILRDMREEGRRWQARMREWNLGWSEAGDTPPVNVHGLPTTRKVERRELRAVGPMEIEVLNEVGSVLVVGGESSPSLEIQKVAWAEAAAEAEARLAGAAVVVDEQEATIGGEQGLRVRIRVETPEDWRDGLVDLALRVPTATSVRVATTFGEVRVENVAGNIECHTSSGDVVLDALTGPAAVETVSGAVRVHDSGGAVSISTKSGDVTADDLRQGVRIVSVGGAVSATHVEGASAEVRTVSGDIILEHFGSAAPIDLTIETVSGDTRLIHARGNVFLTTVSGDGTARRIETERLQAQSVSGDLDVELAGQFAGRVEAGAVSGDIRIAIPTGGDFRYTLSTRTGRLHCDHPAPDAMRTAVVLTGTVGSGGGSVEAKTVSGDILLAMADVSAAPSDTASETGA